GRRQVQQHAVGQWSAEDVAAYGPGAAGGVYPYGVEVLGGRRLLGCGGPAAGIPGDVEAAVAHGDAVGIGGHEYAVEALDTRSGHHAESAAGGGFHQGAVAEAADGFHQPAGAVDGDQALGGAGGHDIPVSTVEVHHDALGAADPDV